MRTKPTRPTSGRSKIVPTVERNFHLSENTSSLVGDRVPEGESFLISQGIRERCVGANQYRFLAGWEDSVRQGIVQFVGGGPCSDTSEVNLGYWHPAPTADVMISSATEGHSVVIILRCRQYLSSQPSGTLLSPVWLCTPYTRKS